MANRLETRMRQPAQKPNTPSPTTQPSSAARIYPET